MNHCGKFANPGFGCGHVVAGLEKLPISLHVTLPPPPVHAPEVTVTSGVFGVYVYAVSYTHLDVYKRQEFNTQPV